MALEAGEMAITVEFAKDLKDKDFFGRQDPYCIVKVGGQQYRTRTATDGGKNPVWHETFRFTVINENDAELIIKDSDVGHDDYIGAARISFMRAREYGREDVQVPVYAKSGKQHGHVSAKLAFTRNSAMKAHGGYQQPYAQYGYPQQVPGYGYPVYGAPPPAQPYYAPPGQQYAAQPAWGAPPPAYAAPAPSAQPPAYGAPAYGAPPPPAPGGAGYPTTYQPPPQQGYPPQQTYPPQQGYPPAPGQYGAPPQYGAQAPGAYPGYPPR